MTPKLRRNRWYRHIPFLLVLILAFGVRFIKIEERPWDSDELGALFRAENAHNFDTHLDQGVAIDGHPALVQTFLWTNAQSWHLNPTQIKCLWATLELVAICFFYLFFWSRLGRRSAFFVAVSLSLLWWPVSMGIWVRPYAIAFFWTSLLALSSERRFRQKNKSFLWILLMSVSMALLAYTHYMAALTGILFLISEWFQKKIPLRILLVVAVLASLLYVPHLGLFLTQLNEGGLSWLGKPGMNFLIDHFYYIFNESNLVLLWIFLMLTIGIVYLRRKGFSQNLKVKLISGIGIWLGVTLISFTYSHVQKPVLQHNALFFALPFLLGGISILFYKLPATLMRFVNFIWVSILFFSLSAEKGHFTTAFEDRYASPIKAISKLESDETKTDLTLLDGPSDVLQFHLKSHPINPVFLLENLPINKAATMDSIFRFKDSSTSQYWVGLHAGSNVNLQTYFWSRFDLIPSMQGGVKRTFITGGEYFVATLSDSSFLERHKSITKMLPINEALFIDFKEIEAKLGTIEPTDVLMVSVEDGFACNEVFREFDLVTAIFQEGFNRALNQIDYRFTSNKSPLNQHNVWLHHPIKLADIPNWDSKSRLRVSYEYRGPEDNQFKASPFRLHIRKIKGNPHLYNRKTVQTIGS